MPLRAANMRRSSLVPADSLVRLNAISDAFPPKHNEKLGTETLNTRSNSNVYNTDINH